MDTVEVMRLVAAAQEGMADQVRRSAEARMAEIGGGPPGRAAGVPDPSLGSTAHMGIGNTYSMLRLYELAEPQFAAAYELSCRVDDPDNAVPAICQANLAEVHLEWALELYRVGEVEEAEKHSLIAESHALRVGRHATASTTYWRD